MTGVVRKSFDHEHEAVATAEAFKRDPSLNQALVAEVSVSASDEKYWVYLTLNHAFDSEEVFQATGYEPVYR